MKKSTLLVLSLFLITGCGSTASSSASSSAAAGSVNEKQTETQPSFQQTIVDDDKVHFEITGTASNSMGYTWNLSITNKTADQNMTVSMDETAINNVSCDPFWATDVTAGNSANSTAVWYSNALENNGITSITKVTFELNVFNSDTLDTIEKNIYTVYPLGEDKAVDSTKQPSASDAMVFDTDQVRMFITGSEKTDTGDFILHAAIVNKTDRTVIFSLDSPAINGMMCDPYWGDSVLPGCSANEDITWYSDALSSAGITDISSIDLPMRADFDDDYSTILEQTYTYTPH